VPYADLRRVANATPVEAHRNESGANEYPRQHQIFDVKKIYALAEDLRLMILLDPEPLSRMTTP
jgi:hypothetical protein